MGQLSFGLPAQPRATVRCLFFALRPDAAANAELDRRLTQWRDTFELRGRGVVPERRHVTLIGVGRSERLPEGHVERLCRAAEGFSAPPFEVWFDRLMRFGGNSVVLAGSHGNPATTALARMLASSLRPYLPPPRGSFAPHLTLLHDRAALLKERPVVPVGWIATEFVLVESHQGRSHHVEWGRWPLRGIEVMGEPAAASERRQFGLPNL